MSDPATSPPVDLEPVVLVPIQPPAKVYGARQRFDLATILVLFVLFSLGFGLMAMLNVFPGVQLWLAGLLVWLAAAQAIFERSCPRRVSRIAGLIYCGIVTPLIVGVIGGELGYLAFISGWIFGVFIGYLGGALVAGVFLVADILRGGKSATESTSAVGFDDLHD
jgi:hypothetical protein